MEVPTPNRDSNLFFLEEIKMIQEVIKRMSSNSFLIKGWVITIFSAVLIFTGEESTKLVLSVIPIVLFWFLDAYFLRQEKLYRELYKWVIENRHKTDDFLFDLDTTRFQANVKNLFFLLFSRSLVFFYLSILLVTALIYLF